MYGWMYSVCIYNHPSDDRHILYVRTGFMQAILTMDIQHRIRALREKKNLTQREAAEGIGTTLQTYQRYEQGTRVPQLDQLIRLCDFYGTSLDYIIGRVNRDDEDINAVYFRTRLKRLRQEKGLSPQELADAVECDVATIHMYENGEKVPMIRRTVKLARALDTTAEYLVGAADDPTRPASVPEETVPDDKPED